MVSIPITGTSQPSSSPQDPVTEICRGALYAVSGYIPASRPATWIVPGLKGRLAISCYLLQDEGHALLIDTGVSVHRDLIGHGVSRLARNARTRDLIMTRREPDAIINLPFLVKRFRFDKVYCGGALNPLNFFERVDQQSVESHVSAIAHSQVDWVRPGAVLPIGRLELEVLRTKLLVLPKNHLFERRTKTLFGSDSWGFLSQRRDGPLEIVSTFDDRLSRDGIARYLRHKFDWLCGADTSSVADEFRRLANDRDIERICSTYGGVIEGRALVQRVLAETVEALRLLSREPAADRIRGFDGAMFARALSGQTLSGQTLSS